MRIKKILFILFLIVIYIFIVNLIPEILRTGIFDEVVIPDQMIQQKNASGEGGNAILQSVGFGDSVSVTVTRPRWYGTRYEVMARNASLYGDIEESHLYIFGISPSIPLKYKSINFIYIHIVFLIIIVFIILYKGGRHEKNLPYFDSIPR